MRCSVLGSCLAGFQGARTLFHARRGLEMKPGPDPPTHVASRVGFAVCLVAYTQHSMCLAVFRESNEVSAETTGAAARDSGQPVPRGELQAAVPETELAASALYPQAPAANDGFMRPNVWHRLGVYA